MVSCSAAVSETERKWMNNSCWVSVVHELQVVHGMPHVFGHGTASSSNAWLVLWPDSLPHSQAPWVPVVQQYILSDTFVQDTFRTQVTRLKILFNDKGIDTCNNINTKDFGSQLRVLLIRVFGSDETTETSSTCYKIIFGSCNIMNQWPNLYI